MGATQGKQQEVLDTVPSLFARLNDDTLNHLIQFLNIRDLGRLDCAMSNKKEREMFWKPCLNSLYNLAMVTSSPSLLSWVVRRPTHSPPELDLWSENGEVQLKVATYIRLLLFGGDEDALRPRSQVVELGVVPRLVELLRAPPNKKNAALQMEAVWSLTILAGANKTSDQVDDRFASHVVDAGAVPLLVSLLLTSDEEDLRVQALWALGILSEGSSKGAVLSSEIIPTLKMIYEDQQASVNCEQAWRVAWVLACLYQSEEKVTLEQARGALSVLNCLFSSKDKPALKYSGECLLSILQSRDLEQEEEHQLQADEFVTDVIASGTAQKLLDLLSYSTPQCSKSCTCIIGPALISLVIILSGSEEQMQAVIAMGLLHALLPLLDHPTIPVRGNVCQCVMRTIRGSPEQVQAVIDAGLFPNLVKLISPANHPTDSDADSESDSDSDDDGKGFVSQDEEEEEEEEEAEVGTEGEEGEEDGEDGEDVWVTDDEEDEDESEDEDQENEDDDDDEDDGDLGSKLKQDALWLLSNSTVVADPAQIWYLVSECGIIPLLCGVLQDCEGEEDEDESNADEIDPNKALSLLTALHTLGNVLMKLEEEQQREVVLESLRVCSIDVLIKKTLVRYSDPQIRWRARTVSHLMLNPFDGMLPGPDDFAD